MTDTTDAPLPCLDWREVDQQTLDGERLDAMVLIAQDSHRWWIARKETPVLVLLTVPEAAEWGAQVPTDDELRTVSVARDARRYYPHPTTDPAAAWDLLRECLRCKYEIVFFPDGDIQVDWGPLEVESVDGNSGDEMTTLARGYLAARQAQEKANG